MHNDIMLDLETMGVGPTAAITAVGACTLDRSQTFYMPVSLKDSVACGGIMDVDTVLWWMKQSDEARDMYTRTNYFLDAVLISFANWLPEKPFIWGNGASFDNVILRSAYERCNIPTPWHYTHDRCYRTIKALSPEVVAIPPTIKHHALADAESQAEHLCRLLKLEI